MPAESATDLHSLAAHGQIKKQFIYFVQKGVQYRKAYVVPANPQTPRQQTKRAFFRMGIAYWHVQPQSFRDGYNEKAKRNFPNMEGFNLFLREWLTGKIVNESVRSIQAGTKVCADGANDVTITAVEVTKTFVFVGTYHCGSSLGVTDEHGICGAELTSATNLRIHAIKGAQADAPSSCWQVVEFY